MSPWSPYRNHENYTPARSLSASSTILRITHNGWPLGTLFQTHVAEHSICCWSSPRILASYLHCATHMSFSALCEAAVRRGGDEASFSANCLAAAGIFA